MQKRGLGRGLSDLLAGTGGVSTRGVIEVEVDRLHPSPFQPRRNFEEEELRDLAASISEQGILQPLLVRETAEGYQIVAGERRWRAASLARLATVPCLVHECDDREALQIALIENLHREDLNPIEQARAFRQLIEEFGMKQEELAERVGKSRPAVANALRLLSLPVEVQDAVIEGTLSEGHARALLALREDPALLYQVCERVIREGLSVRQTEELVRKSSALVSAPGQAERRKAPPTDDPHLIAAAERLQQALATKVQIRQRSNGSGTIRIHYHDAEELGRLLDTLAPEAGI